MSDYLDRDPDFYEADPAARALIEQQRASAIDGIRVTAAVSMTWLGPDGGTVHWALAPDDIGDDFDAQTFLVYCLARAWRDARAALDADDERLSRLLRAALEQGVGE